MIKTNPNNLTIGVVISNLALVIAGIFYPTEYGADIVNRCILLGVITAVSITLLVIALRKNRINGTEKTWIVISSVLAALVMFRWILTMCFTFSWTDLQAIF